MLRRTLLIVPLAAAAVLLPATPAAADHTHFRIVGDGECVLLAPDGGRNTCSCRTQMSSPKIASTHCT
jgi:hypothetical protein